MRFRKIGEAIAGRAGPRHKREQAEQQQTPEAMERELQEDKLRRAEAAEQDQAATNLIDQAAAVSAAFHVAGNLLRDDFLQPDANEYLRSCMTTAVMGAELLENAMEIFGLSLEAGENMGSASCSSHVGCCR